MTNLGERYAKELDKAIFNSRTSDSWDGDGLPPVGTTCEHCPGGTTNSDWEIVTVIAISERPDGTFTDYWLRKESGGSYIVGNPYRFRLLRTEEERKCDEAVNAICDELEVARDCGARDNLAKIYQAIASGKIPHITLK